MGNDTIRKSVVIWSVAAMTGAILMVLGLSAPALSAPTRAGVSREVSFVGENGLTLKGTLLLPERDEKKRFPAMLLLPGSGQPDRDGNVRPALVTDLLKQIAEHLAEHGIATLRFDKRSVASYASQWPGDVEKLNDFFAWDKFAGDAHAAFRYLRQQPEVNPAQTGIIGHSEGGLIALQIAHDLTKGGDPPRALVLLATAGRVLDVVLREQLAYVLPQQLGDKEKVKEYLDYADRAMAQLKKDGTLPENPPPGMNTLFNPASRSLIRTYLTLDPLPLLAAYRGPVLIVQGDADRQISRERDAARLEKAGQGRQVKNCRLLVLPGVGHMLQDPRGKAGPAVAPALLQELESFLPVQLR